MHLHDNRSDPSLKNGGPLNYSFPQDSAECEQELCGMFWEYSILKGQASAAKLY